MYTYCMAVGRSDNLRGLKSSQNKKDLNDITAAMFLVSFSQLPAAKKPTENGAAVMSLRSFLFRDNFRKSRERSDTSLLSFI